jgi:hypothetical protein
MFTFISKTQAKTLLIGTTLGVLFLLWCVWVFAWELDSPYIPTASVLKGQLHCHTTNSDGTQTPFDVENAYRKVGYQFIVLTDHNKVTENPKVNDILMAKGIMENPLIQGIIHLNGCEKTLRNKQHLGKIEGGFNIVNHPNRGFGWPIKDIKKINFSAIEIFNSECQAIGQANAENKWDILLREGYRIWGVATDDSHDINDTKFNDGWVMVFTDDITKSNIQWSLKNGNFYSSTGPIMLFEVKNKSIEVFTGEPSKIEFITKEDTFQRNDVSKAIYYPSGKEIYIRIRVTRNSDGKQAWSNPIFINGI